MGRAPSTFLAPIDSIKAKRLLKHSHRGAVEVIPTAHHASNITNVKQKAKQNAARIVTNRSQPPDLKQGDLDSKRQREEAHTKPRLFKNQLEQKLRHQQDDASQSEHDYINVGDVTKAEDWHSDESLSSISSAEAPFETKIPPRRKTLEVIVLSMQKIKY